MKLLTLENLAVQLLAAALGDRSFLPFLTMPADDQCLLQLILYIGEAEYKEELAIASTPSRQASSPNGQLHR